MRAGILIAVLAFALGSEACRQANAGISSGGARLSTLSLRYTVNNPDFETQVKPIFVSRCQPCHFQGGQVYAQMPFDKPETITRLGEKLFTRIKDEKEQQLIREFLAQAAEK